MTADMSCPQCGVLVIADARFCQSCGVQLAHRGDSMFPSQDSRFEPPPLNSKNKLVSLENIRSGTERLIKVFWIYNVLAVVVFVVVVQFIRAIGKSAENHGHSSTVLSGLIGVVSLILVGYVIWALIMLWRNAYNTSTRVWGHVARGYVVYFFAMFTFSIITILISILKT